MTELNMAQALNAALDRALADERVVLLGEDVGQTGGVFRVSDGLLEKHGPDRVIDTPVSEAGIVGAAYGMAIAGLRPIAEIQFMGFSYPAFDQIISHVSRIRNRSRHRFTAPLVVRVPYGAGIGAAEHHSESTEALYAHVPGLKVVVPSIRTMPTACCWPQSTTRTLSSSWSRSGCIVLPAARFRKSRIPSPSARRRWTRLAATSPSLPTVR